ncbi:unnamed protein product [Aphanomyces euteiches]|uniref:Uncharacterized protein n=1 Tax=Aphanomyces euteiches TaxID=100861 RepID=A0A6G0WZJ5_9STRA|nr:hypothetical protein Ae201684_010057 [Aphanomyces euteiches]KAH9099403.1 hypothetical protein Ae201684P_018419 [Aphanomyces euteiches]KAH9104420.1 hypothetical protein LEN26_015024 [Aphanomyces euteiches]KAH9123718.1 hypothetical protein AeMF1_005379 [Aphanomyces euteiches]KAH9134123.1 hypothetical protein AeRB84_020016 [Aphanomyces euteiches]
MTKEQAKGDKSTAEKRNVNKALFEEGLNATPTEQFDKEFQKYNSKHNSLSATALTLARTELSKANALLWQDDKLKKEGKPPSLTPEDRAKYEQRVKDLEAAIDKYHKAISSSNYTRAILSFAGLVIFILLFILLNQRVPLV